MVNNKYTAYTEMRKLDYLNMSIKNTIKREGYLSEDEYKYFMSIIEHNDNKE